MIPIRVSDEVIYDLADFYKIFGDSTRIKILCALRAGEVCVGDLAESLGLSQPAVSHQLRVLRQNDFVKFRKDGKTVYYSLDDDHIAVLLEQGLDHLLHKKVYDDEN
ncbi:MAG: metalloregulator ArsR/SmtB family transcription factor [Clostridiales bacterium]|nr:metalloregulator ArsR/SmtB family transcription factor [Clostridiales bacterium]